MRFLTLVAVALRSIRARALRSFLTALTVAAGIAGVTSSVALSDGITAQVMRDVRALGLRVVEVVNPKSFPGVKAKGGAGLPSALLGAKAKGGAGLTSAHLEALRAALPDAAVAPTRYGLYSALVEGRKAPLFVLGVGTDPHMREMFDVGMERGRFFDEGEAAAGAKVCVLDSALAAEAFGAEDPLGRTIELGTGAFAPRLLVVGVVEDPFSLREHMATLDSLNPARKVFARILAYRNLYFPIGLLPGGEKTLTSVKVAAATIEDVDSVYRRVRETVGEDLARSSWAQRDWVEMIRKMTGEFNLLGSVVWVAILFITGILIFTVNLIAIRERFFEVGVRRTEGATPFGIWLQLTVESCILSVAGGVGGVLLGIPVGWALARFVAHWDPAFTAKGLLLPIATAILLGILSTLWPAWRAARVNVVEILRKR
jgi:putative ABC transport system permease protein